MPRDASLDLIWYCQERDGFFMEFSKTVYNLIPGTREINRDDPKEKHYRIFYSSWGDRYLLPYWSVMSEESNAGIPFGRRSYFRDFLKAQSLKMGYRSWTSFENFLKETKGAVEIPRKVDVSAHSVERVAIPGTVNVFDYLDTEAADVESEAQNIFGHLNND